MPNPIPQDELIALAKQAGFYIYGEQILGATEKDISPELQTFAQLIQQRKQEDREPLGYIEREQLDRWDILRGTEYEVVERAYIGFSKKPFKTEEIDCTLAVFLTPQPPADTVTLGLDKIKSAMFREAATWTGDHRGIVFLAIADLANRLGVNLSRDDLWEATISSSTHNEQAPKSGKDE